MQYLLKIALKETRLWRLIAIDGAADRAFVAEQIALAFGYQDSCKCRFYLHGNSFDAGIGGKAEHPKELSPFDGFCLKTGDLLEYSRLGKGELRHEITVLKAEPKLFCLIPSCLVGAGNLPDGDQSLNAIKASLENDDNLTLDLKAATKRLRAFGVKRSDISQAMVEAGALPLKFTV